jgi:hypothetical protein
MIIRGENKASRAAANAGASGKKDALQSQTVYLCDMSDASLFLIRYEKLRFEWPYFGLARPLNNDKRRKTLSKSSQLSLHARWSRRGVKISTDQKFPTSVGMIDLVPGQQHDAEVTAHVSPTGVAEGSLWREQSHYALIAEALKTLTYQAISF